MKSVDEIYEMLCGICISRRQCLGITTIPLKSDCKDLKCGIGCPLNYKEERKE